MCEEGAVSQINIFQSPIAMEIAMVYGKGPKTEVTASLTIKDFVEVMESSEPGKT